MLQGRVIVKFFGDPAYQLILEEEFNSRKEWKFVLSVCFALHSYRILYACSIKVYARNHVWKSQCTLKNLGYKSGRV